MEWYTTENGKYRIQSLSGDTFPGALKVITESFCQDESVSIGSEVNKNPLAAEELLELCANAALDGVSLVAVATDTEEVVAACFNKIQVVASESTEKPFFEIFAEERCKQASSKSLIKFMIDVDERCNLFEKYGVDCSFEIMFLATLKEHRNQRLGQTLCRLSVDLAKKLQDGPVSKMTVEDLGPEYASLKQEKPITTYPKICQAIWTAPATQRIGKSLNFEVHATVSFEEFVYNGKTFAERIGPEAPFSELSAKSLF